MFNGILVPALVGLSAVSSASPPTVHMVPVDLRQPDLYEGIVGDDEVNADVLRFAEAAGRTAGIRLSAAAREVLAKLPSRFSTSWRVVEQHTQEYTSPAEVALIGDTLYRTPLMGTERHHSLPGGVMLIERGKIAGSFIITPSAAVYVVREEGEASRVFLSARGHFSVATSPATGMGVATKLMETTLELSHVEARGLQEEFSTSPDWTTWLDLMEVEIADRSFVFPDPSPVVQMDWALEREEFVPLLLSAEEDSPRWRELHLSMVLLEAAEHPARLLFIYAEGTAWLEAAGLAVEVRVPIVAITCADTRKEDQAFIDCDANSASLREVADERVAQHDGVALAQVDSGGVRSWPLPSMENEPIHPWTFLDGGNQLSGHLRTIAVKETDEHIAVVASIQAPHDEGVTHLHLITIPRSDEPVR